MNPVELNYQEAHTWVSSPNAAIPSFQLRLLHAEVPWRSVVQVLPDLVVEEDRSLVVYHLIFRGCTRLLMDLLDWEVDRVVEGGRSRNRVRGLGQARHRRRRLVHLFYIDVDVYCYACCTALFNVAKFHHFVVVGCGAMDVKNDLCLREWLEKWVCGPLPSSVARAELRAFRDA